MTIRQTLQKTKTLESSHILHFKHQRQSLDRLKEGLPIS